MYVTFAWYRDFDLPRHRKVDDIIGCNSLWLLGKHTLDVIDIHVEELHIIHRSCLDFTDMWNGEEW